MGWTYRGAEAPIQLSERKPTFLVKELPLANIAGRAERDLNGAAGMRINKVFTFP